MSPPQTHVASPRARSVAAKASADALVLQSPRSIQRPPARAIDYRIALMGQQALLAYDQPAILQRGDAEPAPLRSDKSRGIFFLEDSKVGNVVLDRMSGVLKISVRQGRTLTTKANARGEEDARYIEVSNGFSIASTVPRPGTESVSWDEQHQLLVSFDTPDPARTKDFRVRLVHEAFIQPNSSDNFRERFRDNWQNFFNREIDDVLGATTVRLTVDEIDALKDGRTIAKSVQLQKPDGSAAGGVAIELSYAAFADAAGGPTRDEWRVSQPARVELSAEAAAARHAWTEMLPIAMELDGAQPVNLSHVAFLEHVESDTQVWVSRCVDTKQVVVAFRGSTSQMDFRVDSNTKWKDVQLPGCPPVRVHSGFLASWLAVDTEVFTLIAACIPKDEGKLWRVTTVGHSLGGSLASMAAYFLAASDAEYEVSMVTAASPRTGNKAFAEAWLNTPNNPVRVVDGVRITNTRDLVPRFPFLRSRWIPPIGPIGRLVAPPQERGSNADDQYNHTMCKTLSLHREGDNSVTVKYYDQGPETATLLDNDIRIWLQVLRYGPIVMDEHIGNYALLMRDALIAEAAQSAEAAQNTA